MYSWVDGRYTSGCRHVNTMFHQPEKISTVQHPGLMCGRVRYLQCFMVFSGWAIANSTRINLSLAIVSMTQKVDEMETARYPVLPWNEPMQGTILSSFFWGYIFLQLPGGQLAEKFGPKVMLTASIFFCGFLTMLTPLVAISGGYYWMILTRALIGLSQGVLYPTIALFLSKWAPAPERGRLVCLVLSGNHFGNLLTMATAGILADSRWGWPSIFYVTGGIAILWTLVYSFIGSSSPEDHKTISESERTYILSFLPNSFSERSKLKTPWRAIVTSPPVWAIVISYFCDCWGFFTLYTQIPRYISGVLGVNIKDNGFLSALPFASSFLASFLFGAINDAMVNKKILTKLASKIFWNSVASWGPAITLGLLAFSVNQESSAMLLLVLSMCIHTATYLGVIINHIDLCPNFSGTLMGIQSGFGCIAASLSPLYTGYIVSDLKSLTQWRVIFLTSAAVFFFGNLVYIFISSVEVQPWNFPTEKENDAQAESQREEEKTALSSP